MIDSKNLFSFPEPIHHCEIDANDPDGIITVVHFTNVGYSAFNDKIVVWVFRVKPNKFLFKCFFQF